MSLSQTNSNKINVVFEAQKDVIRMHLCIDTRWSTYEAKGRAQNVLMFLHTTLDKHRLDENDIDEIGVVMEGESFTATRIITVIANTFGFMKDIKVRSLPKEFTAADDLQKNKLWSEATPTEFVMPQYSGEPTITLKTFPTSYQPQATS